MSELRKARLGEIGSGDGPQEGSNWVDVQFNPTSLRVQISNRTAGGQQAGAQARQRPGTGEMQVSFDLVFDTADEGSTDEPVDVLKRTASVERFVRPRGTQPGQEAPPRVAFEWGSFQVQGVMESANIDLDFFDTLAQRMGAPGDFAQAYVIAHEVGHHVQNLLGITGKMDEMRGKVSQREFNAMSVRVELQADCFAGIWAHHNHKTNAILEPGDVEEALNAAAAIGDDAIQRKSQGQVVPDSFTHGTSEQRQRWFHKGLETGSVQACDTFNTRAL